MTRYIRLYTYCHKHWIHKEGIIVSIDVLEEVALLFWSIVILGIISSQMHQFISS